MLYWKTFSFRIVTEKECFDAKKSIGNNKPLGPSLIPACALKDASSIVTHNLSYIVNNCIKESFFPSA